MKLETSSLNFSSNFYLIYYIEHEMSIFCIESKCALTHRIFLGPGSCSQLVLGTVSLVHVCYLRHQRIIWVWIS